MPQGSIYGPTRFHLFINDLPLILDHCFADFFADDASLHTDSNKIDIIEQHVLPDFSETKDWSKHRKLPINYIYKNNNNKKKKKIDKKKKKNMYVHKYTTTTRRLS